MSIKIRNALVSVSDKEGIDMISQFLVSHQIHIYSTGGTYKAILDSLDENDKNLVHQVSDLTQFPEILEGRVKTLHPKIYGGILARRDNEGDNLTLDEHSIPFIDLVIVNLYPFSATVAKEGATKEEIIENIDIGGPCMLRAAAKNFKDVVILTHPGQYNEFITQYDDMLQNVSGSDGVSESYRLKLACDAFDHVADYDMHIAQYFQNQVTMATGNMPSAIYRHHYLVEPLKYGLNPHQKLGAIGVNNNATPVFGPPLNGSLGYINVLDAIGAWCLVAELKACYPDDVFATSFKHTSPAGTARSRDLFDWEKKWYSVEDKELSHVAKAYLLARYCDPKSSFGDFVAISDVVDESCALLIKREVGDGIIAKGYTQEALEILQAKKGGKYIILQVRPDFDVTTKQLEIREAHGIVLVQESNVQLPNHNVDKEHLSVSGSEGDGDAVSEEHLKDLVLANATLKYTQSNSVSLSYHGQCLVAAGQQNRVDCTRLAGHKMRNLLVRCHPQMIHLFESFKSDIGHQGKVNAIYELLDGVTNNVDYFPEWLKLFEEDKQETIKTTDWNQILSSDVLSDDDHDLCLASDAFFPFEDNIEVAHDFGVSHIVQPMGSIRDKEVSERCAKYGISMIGTGNRLFLH